jgi:hypothetical protein
MKRLDVEGLYPANDFGTKQPIRNVRYHVRLQGKGGNRTRAQLRPGLRPTADIIPDQHIGGRSIGLVRSYRYPQVDLTRTTNTRFGFLHLRLVPRGLKFLLRSDI